VGVECGYDAWSGWDVKIALNWYSIILYSRSYGGFLKWGSSQIFHFLLGCSIKKTIRLFGYPHLWKGWDFISSKMATFLFSLGHFKVWQYDVGCYILVLSLLNGHSDSIRTSRQLSLRRTVVRGVDDVFNNMEPLSGIWCLFWAGLSQAEAICLAMTWNQHVDMDLKNWMVEWWMLKSHICTRLLDHCWMKHCGFRNCPSTISLAEVQTGRCRELENLRPPHFSALKVCEARPPEIQHGTPRSGFWV
jgi:hypothetical protein